MKQNYDFIPVPISVRDRCGRYVYVNKAWREMFSLEDADAMGKTDHDLGLDPLALPDDEAEGPAGSCAFRDVYITTREKGRLLLELIETVVSDGTDEEGIVCVHQDVTGIGWRMEDLTRNLGRSEQKSRQRYQQLLDFSKEISEPLEHMGRCCDNLLRTELDGTQKGWTVLLRDNADLLQRHIARNLDLHGADENGSAVPHDNSVEVKRIIDEVRELYSSIAVERGVYVETRVERELSEPVALDSRRLRQILVSIMDVAVRNAQEGRVAVSASLTPGSDRPLSIRTVIDAPKPGMCSQNMAQHSSIRMARSLCGFIGGRLEIGSEDNGSVVITVFLRSGSPMEAAGRN